MPNVYRDIIDHPSAWTAAELGSRDALTYRLTAAELAAIDVALNRTRHIGLHEVVSPEFNHPVLDVLMPKIEEIVMNGRGLVILSGLERDRYTDEELERIYWGLGSYLGPAVVQSVYGDKMGYVEAIEDDPYARAYRSSDELRYHCDTQELVGLMCLQSAPEGGLSLIASTLAIHNEIQRRRPDLLDALYDGYYLAPSELQHSERPVTDIKTPIYCYRDGLVSCTYGAAFIARAAKVRGAVTKYILVRVALALVALLGVLLFVFVASRLTGDVSYLLAGDSPTPADIARIHQQLGLDKPIWLQFFIFLGQVAQGNFGQSIHYHQPVLSLVGERVPATIELVLTAFAVSQVFGIAFGVIAAVNRGAFLDFALRCVAAVGQSTPNFWLGIVAIMVFAVGLGWFPTSGRSGFSSLVLPALTLALYPLAATMRITRSAMLEAMGSEYVRYLRAKGIKPALIVCKHALRNALVPITALAGSQLSFLLGGTVIVETVFAWPGLGSLLIDAVQGRDYPLIQAAAVLISTAVVFLNLGVDLLFGVIDPRIRYG